jgi:hypothetical protein
LQPARSKVIPVDFTARRSRPGPVERPARVATAREALAAADRLVVFERPPSRHSSSEYLGARWEWGWTLFVWTDDAGIGPVRAELTGARGYVARRWSAQELAAFLLRAREIGGVLVDGDLEGTGDVIRAEPLQLIGRDDALAALER